MNRKKSVVILLFCMTLLSGCWDYDEPERMLYVFGVGLDYKDDQYEVYAQVANFANTAKSEQPSTQKVQSEIGHASGKTLNEALYKLYNSMGQKAFWGHLHYLVLSEEVLKDGNMNPVIDSFLRYRETRYQIWLYSTKDHVKDVLLTSPIVNKAITLSLLADPWNSFARNSYIVPVDFRTLIIGLNEPSHEVAIPSVEVNENWETLEGKEKIVSLTGVGVISPGEFKGFILGDQARGLKWMNNKTKLGELTFGIDSNEENRISAALSKIKVNVEPIVGKSSVKFDIEVMVTATVTLIEGKVTDKLIRDHIVKEVKKEIKETYEEALKKDIDIFRLSEYVYRKDLKAWKKYQENGKVELSEDSIRKLTVKIDKLDAGRFNFQPAIE